MSHPASSFHGMPEFVPLAERIVDALLEADPGLATSAGDHRYDDRLPDLSPGAVAERVTMLRDATDALAGIDPEASTRRTRSTTPSSRPWSSAGCSS